MSFIPARAQRFEVTAPAGQPPVRRQPSPCASSSLAKRPFSHDSAVTMDAAAGLYPLCIARLHRRGVAAPPRGAMAKARRRPGDADRIRLKRAKFLVGKAYEDCQGLVAALAVPAACVRSLCPPRATGDARCYPRCNQPCRCYPPAVSRAWRSPGSETRSSCRRTAANRSWLCSKPTWPR